MDSHSILCQIKLKDNCILHLKNNNFKKKVSAHNLSKKELTKLTKD